MKQLINQIINLPILIVIKRINRSNAILTNAMHAVELKPFFYYENRDNWTHHCGSQKPGAARILGVAAGGPRIRKNISYILHFLALKYQQSVCKLD